MFARWGGDAARRRNASSIEELRATFSAAAVQLKRSIARAEVEVETVIRDCPWETESMTVAELLTSQRRWGRTRARKFLQALSISENKRIGTLTPRQRALIASALAAKASDPAGVLV